MRSSFRQFPEIDNLQHTRVWCSVAQRKLQMELSATPSTAT